MISSTLLLFSLACAHSPFRLNTQGDATVNGLNITLGAHNALTTSNGTSLSFWIEEEAGEEFGTYFVNTGSLLTSDNNFIVASEKDGYEPGAFNITSEGLLALNNSTRFWVCPNDDGDIAIGGPSPPCQDGIEVGIKATPQDMDEAYAEYESMVASANSSTSAATTSTSATGTGDAHSTKSTRVGSTSTATAEGTTTAVSTNAAVALVPAALFAGLSLFM